MPMRRSYVQGAGFSRRYKTSAAFSWLRVPHPGFPCRGGDVGIVSAMLIVLSLSITHRTRYAFLVSQPFEAPNIA